VNYGYEGEVLLLAELTPPATLAPGQAVTLAARADWLICKDICIPDGADLKLALPVREDAGPSRRAAQFAAARAQVPPPLAIELLRKAGIKRALVSSSNDDGNQMLVAAAPELILSSLRPYRTRGELGTWVRDESVIGYLEQRLARFRYVAIGEFHVYGADADLPVVRRVVELARQHGLILHSHSDADAIERQFRQWPQARILWAHAGFDSPARVREMLRRYPRLWCDLAFRSDHAPGGTLDPEWRALFLEFPDRFLVGTDTFTPERWPFVVEHARFSRQWLAQLPREVAERIAWKNGEALFARSD
ncbi:MAG: protein-disulfide reductase DsbD family protein, partial [Burkholderiaceae bacterium]|nr:protein-disulfide reductase DsbD family protein [Burkholderiaceae bacterium]